MSQPPSFDNKGDFETANQNADDNINNILEFYNQSGTLDFCSLLKDGFVSIVRDENPVPQLH